MREEKTLVMDLGVARSEQGTTTAMLVKNMPSPESGAARLDAYATNQQVAPSSPSTKENVTPDIHSTPLVTAKNECKVASPRSPSFTSSFDTFFSIMLRTSVEDYVEAGQSDDLSEGLWMTLCQRANIPVPTQRIAAVYGDVGTHFEVRAALVLEEARDAISKALFRRWMEPTPTTTRDSLDVVVTNVDSRGNGITKLTLQKWVHDPTKDSRYFTAEQKEHLNYCVILECFPKAEPHNMSNTVLGFVLPCKRERIHRLASFDLAIYRHDVGIAEDAVWTLRPVGNFISAFRQFGACTDYAAGVILKALLGTCPSGAFVKKEEAPSLNLQQQAATLHRFRLSPMNATQEKAMAAFLDSPPASISIIQGPPGTGKTSLLVNVICQYLDRRDNSTAESDNGSRQQLVVSAPTNKAVSVLALRLLEATSDSDGGCKINIVLVGDDEKLLFPDHTSNPLLPHYVYTWHTQILKKLLKICQFFDPKSDHRRTQSREDMLTLAVSVRKRIFQHLSLLPPEIKSKVDELCTALQLRTESMQERFRLATIAHRAIKELKEDAVLFDLMASADVILSTLCSSGSNVMRLSKPIDALIVDEAGAATEPDLYIPFHLKPSRLLVVGDPKQLPATVLSERAKKFGLDVSLQERLMNQCGYDFTMLDTQYRMHPEISAFPSRRFYRNMIGNGENVKSPTYGGHSQLFDGRPYVFLQIAGREKEGAGGSKSNVDEADAIVDLVKRLVNRRDKTWCSIDRLRIITFYTAQVLLLRKLLRDVGLKNVLVATVDSSQGCEADVVIISLVRCNSAGFLKDDRRMNVALTRARHQLICVGNVHRYPEMVNAHTLHHLAADARNRNVIITDATGHRSSPFQAGGAFHVGAKRVKITTP